MPKRIVRKLFLGEWNKRYPTTELDFNFHFPRAVEWMWDSKNCVSLGKFTDNNGYNFDLGVRKNYDGSYSYAIVYSNCTGDYISGTVGYTPDRVTAEGETKRRFLEWKRKYNR